VRDDTTDSAPDSKSERNWPWLRSPPSTS